MTKTKQKRKGFLRTGPVPSDHPIYSSGYVMLRPVHGRTQKPADDAKRIKDGDEKDIS